MLYTQGYKPFTSELDMSKPVWFCDVDGVLNTLPFERNWIGKEDRTFGMYDPELWNPDNWETVQLKPNTKNHFSTTEVTVYFNRYADSLYHQEKGEEDLQQLRMRYSSTLIRRIRNLIESNAVNFIWLTAWQSEATRILNPLFGFPDIPFIAFNKHTSRGSDIAKFDAVLDFFDEYKADVRWVWTDDTATTNFVQSWGRQQLDKLIPARDRFIINTDPKWGITRSQIHRIEKFIHSA